MIIHIFKWKGKKAKKETLKWAKKEKKYIFSEKNFRGKSCSILKSFEGCKVPRFSHLLHTFFSDFFSMFNICEMTAFLYLKLDASRFVGEGLVVFTFSWERKFMPKGLLLAGNCLNPCRRTCQVLLCYLPPFSTCKSNMQLMVLEWDHSKSRNLSWQLFSCIILLLNCLVFFFFPFWNHF